MAFCKGLRLRVARRDPSQQRAWCSSNGRMAELPTADEVADAFLPRRIEVSLPIGTRRVILNSGRRRKFQVLVLDEKGKTARCFVTRAQNSAEAARAAGNIDGAAVLVRALSPFIPGATDGDARQGRSPASFPSA